MNEFEKELIKKCINNIHLHTLFEARRPVRERDIKYADYSDSGSDLLSDQSSWFSSNKLILSTIFLFFLFKNKLDSLFEDSKEKKRSIHYHTN